MSLPNFNTNIEVEAVLSQLREEQERKLQGMRQTPQREYNPKRYLNASLSKQEESKQLIIRLLPFSKDGGSPFHKVHMHTVRVNSEVASSGWKTLTCASKNSDLPGEKHACPFCETAIAARQMAKTTFNEAEKKKLNDIAFANSASEMWIVRCIERGHEDEGVKFWLFPNPKNGGIYQTIMNIYKTRKEAGERRGEVRNIFDLSNGKDLIITIKRGADGKRKIDIVDDDDFSSITTDIDLGNSWIQDETKWTDLYPVKREDYMSILVEGGVPYWDKEKNAYVDKETYQTTAQTVQREKELEQAAQITTCPVDYTKPIEEASVFGKIPANIPNHLEAPSKQSPNVVTFAVNTNVTEDEMPPQPNWEDDLPF